MKNEELFDQIRVLLLQNGPMKTQEIVYDLDEQRTRVTKVLKENPYTFDFKIKEGTKVWELI